MIAHARMRPPGYYMALLDACCMILEVRFDEVAGPRRTERILDARAKMAGALHHVLGFSLPEIIVCLGRGHTAHSTVQWWLRAFHLMDTKKQAAWLMSVTKAWNRILDQRVEEYKLARRQK